MSANVSLLNSANSIQRLIQESLGRVHSPERSYSFHKNSLGGQIRPGRPAEAPPYAVATVGIMARLWLRRQTQQEPTALLFVECGFTISKILTSTYRTTP